MLPANTDSATKLPLNPDIRRPETIDIPANVDNVNREARFDRISKLAQSYFNAEYALITEIKGDMLHYRSTQGISLQPRLVEGTICEATIKAGETVVIEDLAGHPVYKDHPRVIGEPGFRFYAGTPLRDRQGNVIGTLCILDSAPRMHCSIDISMLEMWAELAEDELAPGVRVSQQRTATQLQSAYDPLTSFLTLSAYRQRVDEMIARVQAENGRADRINIRVHDLNEFNGRDRVLSGDAVLIEMALRVQEAVAGHTVEISRYRANGVGVTLENCRMLDVVVQRLRESLERPIETAFGSVTPIIHIVVTTNIERFQNRKDIIRLNDKLFESAPTTPGAHVVRHNDANARAMTRSIDVANRLRTAIDQGELQVHYQPKVDAEKGRVQGLEALLRWMDDRLGQVQPIEMIAVAEEYGFAEALDEYVLDKVCADLASWRQQSLSVVPVSVNIASEHLQLPEFPKKVESVLEKHHVMPCLLEIEILESVAVRETAAVISNMRHLRDIGVRFSIDDFGTGYSSLSYLLDLPLDSLKIDRAFIRNIIDSPKAAALAQAIVTIGHEAGMTVIAEGVEDLAQFLIMRNHRCDQIQGYFFSKPLPADDIICRLSNGGHFAPPKAMPLFAADPVG